MRALLATDIHLGVPSASRTRLAHMAEALAREGIEPIIGGVGGHAVGMGETTWNGYRTICYSGYEGARGWSPAMRLANAAGHFYRRYSGTIIERFDVSVIVGRFNTTRPLESLIETGRERRVPVVADMVECYNPSFRMVLNGVWWEQNRLLRCVASKLDGIIGISGYWIDLAKKHRLPHVLIPPFAASKEFRAPIPRKPDDPFRIVFLGHWVKRENPKLFLDALEGFLQRGHDVELIVLGKIGQSWWEQKAMRHLRQLTRLNSRVRFHGFVSNEERDRMLEEASAFIILRSPNRETAALFPTRLPEYLLSGNPVVLSAAGFFPSCFRDREDVLFVSPNARAQELTDALVWLKEHPENAHRIGQNGRRRAIELFSFDVLAPKLKAFLEAVVDAGPRCSA